MIYPHRLIEAIQWAEGEPNDSPIRRLLDGYNEALASINQLRAVINAQSNKMLEYGDAIKRERDELRKRLKAGNPVTVHEVE